MTAFRNQTVLITGAAAGIGRLMAEMIAREGAKSIHLWDLDQEGLEATCRLIGTSSCALFPLSIDITDRDRVRFEADEIAASSDPVSVLINNAGVIFGGPFISQTPETIERTVAVNLLATMQITHAFLPQIILSKRGHIVNIASAAGLVSNPGMAVYSATKWGVIGWSDSLRLELERSNAGVHVTTVTPFYISTGMFDGVSLNFLLPMLDPSKVARAVIRGVKKNRLFIAMPWLITLTPFAKGLLPVRWFDWFVGGVLGVYHSMDHFTGHQKPS